jgi:4-methylaminobutanoate oxidase (formaldehyde-forming)
VITGSSFVSNDLAWIRMHIQPDDEPVEVRDITTDWGCLALWGPLARHVLARITQDDVSNQAIPYLQAREITIKGARVLAQRVSYAGELGWELYVAPNRAMQVWDAIVEAGKAYDLEVGGYRALDSLRLEKGYRYFTADVTSLENPYEAGLGFCVRLNKGDFIGREALIKAKEAGLTQKLCTITLEGEDYLPIYGGEAVYQNGQVLSRIRSGGYGYSLKRNIAYAYLPTNLAVTGTPLEVEVFENKLAAEVAPDVLYDPLGERLRN